ncbi:Sarcoglycan complex subunit protein family-containing protein [Aphelenchoides bicaudatus]|nr:Sarcoglycan complex subunit protein family-containing protein [Aphelenchoides bicaudatus]
MKVVNERYGMGVQCNDESRLKALILYDNFHQKQRDYPIKGLDLEQEKVSVCRLLPADMDYQLLIVHPYYARSVDLYLLKLDHEEMTCTALDKRQLSEFPNPLIYDEKDPHRFMLYLMRPRRPPQLQIGRIVEGKMQIEKRVIEIEVEHIINGSRLVGDKAYALARTSRDEEYSVSFYEFSLDEGIKGSRTQKLFDVELEEGPAKSATTRLLHHTWAGPVCYLTERDVVQFERVSICSFDTRTRRMERLGLFGLGSVADIRATEDGVVTLCMQKRMQPNGAKHVVYRCALKQPDTLANLSLFAIRQKLNPDDQSLYERIVINGGENLTQFMLQDGTCRFDSHNNFKIINSRDGKTMFSAQHPMIKIDERIKKISTGRIVTNKIRAPINQDLHVQGENVNFRGNEGIRIQSRKFHADAATVLRLKTSPDGALRLTSRHIRLAGNTSSLPVSSSPALKASVDGYRICVCSTLRPKLFIVGANKPCKAKSSICK